MNADVSGLRRSILISFIIAVRVMQPNFQFGLSSICVRAKEKPDKTFSPQGNSGPPAPPTPTTVIRGLISDSFWGRLRLIVIRLSPRKRGGYLLGAATWARFRKDPSLPPAFLIVINSLWDLAYPTQHIA